MDLFGNTKPVIETSNEPVREFESSNSSLVKIARLLQLGELPPCILYESSNVNEIEELISFFTPSLFDASSTYIVKDESPPIDEIKNFITNLTNTSFSGKNKLGIVFHANTLSQTCANAFLTFMESSRDTTIIFCTPAVKLVLPTIISRCIRFVSEVEYRREVDRDQALEYIKAIGSKSPVSIPQKEDILLDIMFTLGEIIKKNTDHNAIPMLLEIYDKTQRDYFYAKTYNTVVGNSIID